MFVAGSDAGNLLTPPRRSVIREWAGAGGYRRFHFVVQRREQSHRTFDSNRLALVHNRRALVIDVEVTAQIAADTTDLHVRQPTTVRDIARQSFVLAVVSDDFFYLERTAGAGGLGVRFVKFSVCVLVNRGAGDVTCGSENAIGNIPFERPLPNEVFVEIEKRYFIGFLGCPAQIGQLAFRELLR